MRKYKIFVSGVQKELANERQAVKELISENILLREHFTVFLFEDLPAKSKPASKAYLEEVDKSDIYIGIFGNSYGTEGPQGVSATELEFRRAQKQDKEILIYLKGWSDSKRDKELKNLIKEIEKSDSGYIYKQFNEIPELKTDIFESLVTFLKERGVISKTLFDMSVCEGATNDDIDEEKVRWFLRTAKIIRNYSLDENTPLKEAFIHLNLLKDDKLTNAAILLFGMNPPKYHIQAEVKCLHFHGTEIEKPFKSYHIYKGNIFEQIDKTLGFVLDTLSFPVIRQPGTVAVKRPYEIPEFVIQEAIVNAVAHRDYYSSAGVQVMVFIDRIEIWNPGQLPPQLTIESLKKPHASYPHNPLLAEALYLTNYIQKAGSGTIEMIRQCKNNGLPEPEFVQEIGQFITKIRKDIYTDSYLSKLGLNERQVKAVKYVKEKRRIANKEYQDLTRVSKPMATIDLKDLVRKKVFERVGTTGRGTEYILAKG